MKTTISNIVKTFIVALQKNREVKMQKEVDKGNQTLQTVVKMLKENFVSKEQQKLPGEKRGWIKEYLQKEVEFNYQLIKD